MILIFSGPTFDDLLDLLVTDRSKRHNYETYIIKKAIRLFIYTNSKYIMSIDRFREKL